MIHRPVQFTYIFSGAYVVPFFQELNPVARRLQEHECRMLARGFPVQPVVGAGDNFLLNKHT